MENIFERLGLYDIFARGLTGTAVILMADLLGFFDLFRVSDDKAAIPVGAILIAGYFCGLLLEEISYWLEKIPCWLEKIFCRVKKFSKYLKRVSQFRKKTKKKSEKGSIEIPGERSGRKLKKVYHRICAILGFRSAIEQEIVCRDEYLSYSFRKCKDALIKNNSEHVSEEPLTHIVMSASFRNAFIVLAVLKHRALFCVYSPEDFWILIGLALIFHLRMIHYSQRRAEEIFDYCIAKQYPDIKKEEDESPFHLDPVRAV